MSLQQRQRSGLSRFSPAGEGKVRTGAASLRLLRFLRHLPNFSRFNPPEAASASFNSEQTHSSSSGKMDFFKNFFSSFSGVIINKNKPPQ